MPFTHSILAYSNTREELKDSQQREESASKAWELATEYAETLNTDTETWQPVVRVEIVPKQ